MKMILSVPLSVAAALVSTEAMAQTSASPFTSGFRYDGMGRITGTIAPDPDGAGPLKHAAVRNTYDIRGSLSKVETGELSVWKDETIAPSAWGPSFNVLSSVEYAYDGMARKVKEVAKDSGGMVVSKTHYSYDSVGRLQCAAVRMNPGVFLTEDPAACSLGAAGSDGPDRITKNVYDLSGQLIQVRRAVGVTGLEQAHTTYSYTANGKQQYVIDANGNRAKLEYDGFDRQTKWIFPSTTRPSSYDPTTQTTALASAGTLNTSDYEQYGYDANSNRTSLRKRSGQVIGYSYDALNRMTVKDIPGGTTNDVFYSYNLRGLQLYARYGSSTGTGITNAYDGFGRLSSSTSTMGSTPLTLSYCYDVNGNRIRLGFPDSSTSGGNCSVAWTNYYTYEYDGLNRLTAIKENGGAVIVSQSYNARTKRASLGGGVVSSYGYDTIGRISSIGHDLAGSYQDVTYGFASYNAQNQLLTRTISNDSYTWTGASSANSNYTTNGLNQYTAVGGSSISYDANGNLTADPCYTYGYDVENRLTQRNFMASGACPVSYAGATNVTLSYDPNGRLSQTTDSAATIRFLYDGDALVAEYDGSNNLLRRYVHGSGVDEPLAWYEGSGLGNRRALRADHQGSVIAVTDGSGNSISPNTYDEYGQPSAYNLGRFQYTGQIWLPEVGLYHYKARVYSPKLGRFLQTDPIGYDDQVNFYAYVANDPVNGQDPSGMRNCAADDTNCIETPESAQTPGEPTPLTPEQQAQADIVVTAQREKKTSSGDSIPLDSNRESFYVVTADSINRRGMKTTNVDCGGGTSIDVGRPGPLGSGQAAAHTHGPNHDSTPGPGDNIAARASSTGAAFVMTSNNVFMVRSFGNGTYATNVLSGAPLTAGQTSALRGYMQGWEGPTVNNASLSDRQRFCPK